MHVNLTFLIGPKISCFVLHNNLRINQMSAGFSHDKVQILVSCNNSNLHLARNQELAPPFGELSIQGVKGKSGKHLRSKFGRNHC